MSCSVFTTPSFHHIHFRAKHPTCPFVTEKGNYCGSNNSRNLLVKSILQMSGYISNFTTATLIVTFDLLKTERLSPIQVLCPWSTPSSRAMAMFAKRVLAWRERVFLSLCTRAKPKNLVRFLDLKCSFMFCDAWKMPIIGYSDRSEESRHLLKFSWNRSADESLMDFTWNHTNVTLQARNTYQALRFEGLSCSPTALWHTLRVSHWLQWSYLPSTDCIGRMWT